MLQPPQNSLDLKTNIFIMKLLYKMLPQQREEPHREQEEANGIKRNCLESKLEKYFQVYNHSLANCYHAF